MDIGQPDLQGVFINKTDADTDDANVSLGSVSYRNTCEDLHLGPPASEGGGIKMRRKDGNKIVGTHQFLPSLAIPLSAWLCTQVCFHRP